MSKTKQVILLVAAMAVTNALCNTLFAAECRGKDGKVIKLEKPKRQAPNVREYTQFYGMMGQDSVFVTNKGKYCLIKANKNGRGWHPVWLKVE